MPEQERRPHVQSFSSAMLGGLLAVAMWAPGTVHAQAPQLDPSHVAERRSIGSQLSAAEGLYVTSSVLLTGGGVTIYGALFALFRCSWGPGACADSGATIAFFLGAVAAPLGLILLAIAIGLDVDAHVRRGALRARGLSIAPGPGDVGLGFALSFDATR